MSKKRKIIIGVVVAVIVCLSVVGVWKRGIFEDKETSCALMPPNPVLNVTKTDGNYTINIKYILSHHHHDPYQLTSYDILWLNISEVWFVLREQKSPGCPQFKTIMEIINGSATEDKGNYTHGKLIDILNNTSSNITYYDNDDDGILSVNDTFLVKLDAIPNNVQYMSFYLVYKGTYQGRFNSEIITGLGVTWWEGGA